jgi:HSP20 family protein
MNLIPWKQGGSDGGSSPAVRTAQQLRWEMDRMFDRFFADPWGVHGDFWRGFGDVALATDVSETDDEVVVRAEIPGVEPKDLELTVAGDVLTIAGEKHEEETKREKGYARAERRFGSFRRSVQLPSSIDADSVQAVHKNGVVTVTLKKVESARPKRISVKTT